MKYCVHCTHFFFFVEIHTSTVLKTGVVEKARGSAYVEMGSTKVTVAWYDIPPPIHTTYPHPLRLTAVISYGPRETSNTREFSSEGKVECAFKFAPFSCTTRRGHIQVCRLYWVSRSSRVIREYTGQRGA